DAPGGPLGADPKGCTPTREYDASIPTFSSVVGDEAGGNPPAGVRPHHSADLYKYQEAVVAATKDNPRVKVIEKDLGATGLGTRRLKIVIAGTPGDIDNLDTGL